MALEFSGKQKHGREDTGGGREGRKDRVSETERDREAERRGGRERSGAREHGKEWGERAQTGG